MAEMNPYGASLNPMFGSDIGHFDVEGVRGSVDQAHELVNRGLMSPEDLPAICTGEPRSLAWRDEQGFLQGHQVEAEAKTILTAEEVHRATVGEWWRHRLSIERGDCFLSFIELARPCSLRWRIRQGGSAAAARRATY